MYAALANHTRASLVPRPSYLKAWGGASDMKMLLVINAYTST